MTVNKNRNNPTLDLFATPASSATDTPTGDGATPTTEAGAELPAFDDTELVVPESFRVPGLKNEVLPVCCFSLRLVREHTHLTRQIHTPADVARLCCEMLEGYDREVFLAIALSTANRVIGAHICHVGTVDASIASPREVYKFCLLANARSVVVAHNHPSGNITPSSADISVSKQLKAAGDQIGVRLLDSLVCTFDGKYTSLVEKGLL